MIISVENEQSVVSREKGENNRSLYLYLIVQEGIYFLSSTPMLDEKRPGNTVQKAILPDHLRFDGTGTHIKLLPNITKQ